MKRNNIFMWAYISFILVSTFTRLLFEYSLWPQLVLAITFSTVLFAFEDLFISLGNALKDSCDIAEDFSARAYEDLESRLSLFEKIDEKANCYQNTHNDISDIRDSFISHVANTEELFQALKDLLREVQDKRNKQSQYNKIANVLAYFGFLILFCILIFSSFWTIPAVAQEIVTVFSFAVILITHQIKIILSMRIRKEITDSQNALHMRNEARDYLLKREEKLDYLIELIESSTTETEEQIHAD